MLGYIRRIIRDLRGSVSSLVRQHTGLLVSLCIVAGCLFIAGCGDDAVLYEVGADADGADAGQDNSPGQEASARDMYSGDTESARGDAGGTQADPSAADISSSGDPAGAVDAEDTGRNVLVVHLCGAVNNPGVYELDLDSRIIDGINKAGGFRDDASEDSLNLAMEITDGSRIYVPTVEEAAQAEPEGGAQMQTAGQMPYITGPNVPGTNASGLNMTGSENTSSDGGRININTAGEEELTRLTGIGPGRAKAIIAYREEHGGFKSAEEIMNVSGIGKASFEKLKNDITI